MSHTNIWPLGFLDLIMKNKSNHIPILGSLRAFAALSVCLFHFVCTTTNFITDETIRSIFGNGKYGVQMFFVISGFIIPWSMYNTEYKVKDIFKFIGKRFMRLEPPYIVSVILAIIIIVLRQRILHNFDVQFSSTQILLHFGYLIPFFEKFKWLNQVYWTLAIEFQYYLTIALLFPLIIHSKKQYRFLIYFVFSISCIFTGSEFLPYWLPIFLMGVILFLKLKNIIKGFEFYTVLLVLSLWSFYKYDSVCIIFSLSTVVAILYFRNRELKVGSFFGEISYSIYLIHSLIAASFINIFSHNIVVGWQKLVLILLGVIITVFSAWIMYLFVEKPSKKISSNIKYKK